jgi:cysteine desulfurase
MESRPSPIYLDFNATTPLIQEVKDAITSSLDTFGNPSSKYSYGEDARSLVRHSRRQVN